MPIYPPDDPFLINAELFGISIVIRWYGVIIVTAAVVAGWFAARRAQQRGYNPDHVWNLLMLGMILGIIGARTYYVIFEWPRFAGQPFIDIINPRTGGLAIHGGIIGALVAAFLYTTWNKLPFFMWLDICAPAFLLGQALGRWGNFFNQEAYGRPTDLPFGVIIDGNNRLPPFDNLEQYPPDTLFHATFLYESVWNLMGVGVLIWLERRFHKRLRVADIALGYAIWYGAGRLWVEGLRTDSLCTSGFGGSCEEALRVAQIASLLLIAGGLIGLYLNHRFRPTTTPQVAEVQPDDMSDGTLNANPQQEQEADKKGEVPSDEASSETSPPNSSKGEKTN